MKLKQLFVTTAAAVVSMGMFAPNADASTIGWNFSRGDTLATTDAAGAPGYVQANWNNHEANGQGPGTVPFGPLVDDGGALTGVSVTDFTLAANNSWSYGEKDTPDEKLVDSFADTLPSITFSNLHDFTLDGYTVVVYYGNNEWNFNPFSALTVNDQTQNIRTEASLRTIGSYTLGNGTATSTFEDTNTSRYSVFTGVNGDDLTISLATLSGNNNNGISAIQIVANPIPEPASLALLGLGGILMLRRRRHA